MATPINAPMAGEIWHLSIDDLFQPVQEAPRLGGDGPFVINLSASTAPISIPTKAFAGCSHAHVYQIQVTEDGRTRYRLRLGPFATEDEADAILAVARDTYPGALTATAGPSDLRVIGNMQAKLDSRQPSARKPTEATVIEKTAPKKAAAENRAPQQPVKNKADAEISIDLAWPAPQVAIPPAAAAPLELASEWALPELDIPLPDSREANWVANVTPVLTEVVAPQIVAPPIKVPAPKIAAPPRIAAPVLTEVVAPRAKAPVVIAPAAAAAQPAAPKPTPTTKAPAPPAAPVAATPIAPVAVVATPEPAPKQAAAIPTAAPAKPTPPKIAAPPLKVAAPPPKIAAPPPKIAAPAAEKRAPILTQSLLSLSKAAAAKLRHSAIKSSVSRLTSLQPVVVATAPAPAPAPSVREVKKLDEPLESLESTQTMRALTPMELEDVEVSRWFVIQLALADEAFDPDAVPNLDIFSEYRLYSVAGIDQGRIVHALRLGFFREEIGAVAVASYLAAYWDKPTITRVSLAERDRFADQRVEARKDVGATGRHAVIEITDELVARRRRSSKSSVSI